jgi:hypothetical protein
VDRKLVSCIFVDETMIRIRGRQAWVWVAYEPGLRVFLSIQDKLQSGHPGCARVPQGVER